MKVYIDFYATAYTSLYSKKQKQSAFISYIIESNKGVSLVYQLCIIQEIKISECQQLLSIEKYGPILSQHLGLAVSHTVHFHCN
jgi:hypothetical protein